MLRRPLSDQSGFTLVEALVVTGIIVVLFGISIVSLGQPQSTANTLSAVDTLVSDLNTQQAAAMAGATGSTTTQVPAGVFIQNNQYTLFTSATYTAGNSYNYIFPAPNGVTFSTTFPGSTVTFNKGTGEVSGFTAGSNTITVTTTAGSKTVTINRFGAITVL